MVDRARSPMRFLAPLALVAATLVFLVVIVGAVAGGGGDDAGPQAAQERERGGRAEQGGGSQAETYQVQDGDTLDGIAAETGVSVEKLQELNPDLDPQSLIAGQELQLNE